MFQGLAYNTALNESSTLGVKATDLAQADCEAHKDGNKFAFSELLGHVLIKYSAKADY